MKSKLCIGTLLSALSLNSLACFAGEQTHHFQRAHFAPHKIMRMAKQLDLTKAQREQVFAIVDEYRPLMRERMFRMHDSRERIRAIVAGEVITQEEIDRLAAELGQDAEQIFKSASEMMIRISAVLSPEQREELVKLLEKKRSRGQRRF